MVCKNCRLERCDRIASTGAEHRFGKRCLKIMRMCATVGAYSDDDHDALTGFFATHCMTGNAGRHAVSDPTGSARSTLNRVKLPPCP